MSLSDNDFYSVAIQLPKNPDRRRALVTRLRLGADFMGGPITAAGLGDVFTDLEQLEALLESQDY